MGARRKSHVTRTRVPHSNKGITTHPFQAASTTFRKFRRSQNTVVPCKSSILPTAPHQLGQPHVANNRPTTQHSINPRTAIHTA